jgi:hypothetical protein
MAKMYPTELSPKTKSPAEKMLYKLFRDKLSDEYHVYHNIRWQGIDDKRRARDGETDFIIAHPEQGILLIEVKGGEIYRDENGRWHSIDGQGKDHKLDKDPFEQVMESKHQLLDYLKRCHGWPPRFVTFGHAVAFPDTVFGPEDLGPDMRRSIIMDCNEANNVDGWVKRVMDYYRGNVIRSNVALGSDGMKVLYRQLAREIRIKPKLWAIFQQEQREMLELTEEQYDLLDSLDEYRQYRISGPAGSGKTMLAIEKAIRLRDAGQQVLLVCYNHQLAEMLAKRVGRPYEVIQDERFRDIDVFTYHSLCTQYANEARISLSLSGNDAYYREELPNALLQAIEKVPQRYDAIIVDEGQDFFDNYWFPLQMLLADEKQSIFYIFYDDNQRIYSSDQAMPIQTKPFRLTVNCRNTQLIHKVLLKYYHADKVRAKGPVGRPVQLLTYKDEQEVDTVLGNLLVDLVENQKIPRAEIIVLTALGKEKSRILSNPPKGKIRLNDYYDPFGNSVETTTIQAFKGMERMVVILADIDHFSQKEKLGQLVYVGCSRACNQLYVLVQEKNKRLWEPIFLGRE